MNYLIAVLPDRIQAEAAYSALEERLPGHQVDILGSGYKSADEYGLIDPNQQFQRGQNRFSWLIPFGFGAGYAFNVLTGIELFSTIGPFGNHLIGGLLGAAAGGLGAYFVGGGLGLALGSGDALPYRNRLDAGKYLVVVRGTEELTRQATSILRQFEPESIQGYAEPTETKVM